MLAVFVLGAVLIAATITTGIVLLLLKAR